MTDEGDLASTINLLAFVFLKYSCGDGVSFRMKPVSSSIMILMYSRPDIYESLTTLDSQTFRSCAPATVGFSSVLVYYAEQGQPFCCPYVGVPIDEIRQAGGCRVGCCL